MPIPKPSTAPGKKLLYMGAVSASFMEVFADRDAHFLFQRLLGYLFRGGVH
jgi:hypothetical protein